jgi:hypothetical protein
MICWIFFDWKLKILIIPYHDIIRKTFSSGKIKYFTQSADSYCSKLNCLVQIFFDLGMRTRQEFVQNLPVFKTSRVTLFIITGRTRSFMTSKLTFLCEISSIMQKPVDYYYSQFIYQIDCNWVEAIVLYFFGQIDK